MVSGTILDREADDLLRPLRRVVRPRAPSERSPVPSGAGRPLVSCAGMAVVVLWVLTSCASPSIVTRMPDVSNLNVDPQKFLTIVLRDDIEIETAVIRASAAAMSRSRWLVLQYVEQENRKGFVPDRESEYANLFLVREVQAGGGHGGAVRDRYLVVDLWHYYPRDGIKTCHEWTVWEDDGESVPARASFRLLVEDFNNVFLGEQHASLDPRTVELLGGFFLKAKGFFARRAKDLRIDASVPGRDRGHWLQNNSAM